MPRYSYEHETLRPHEAPAEYTHREDISGYVIRDTGLPIAILADRMVAEQVVEVLNAAVN